MALALVIMTQLIGCRHPLEIIGQGDIRSRSGDRHCFLEQYEAGDAVCSENLVTGPYSERYTAIPRDGWQFYGWGNYGKYCDGSANLFENCKFDLSQELVDQGEGWTAPPLVAYFREEIDQGYNALFMGHSFFIPLEPWFNDFAQLAGFSAHTVQTVEGGNEKGSAQYLWENEDENHHEIKRILERGGLSLVGMNYHFYGGEEGYLNWIGYALESNPDAAFFITMPWLPGPYDHTPEALKELKEASDGHHHWLHAMINTFRAEFPGTNIFCIPYGDGVLELRKLYDAGKLPELETLVTGEFMHNAIGPPHGIFSDSLGHAEEIIFHLASLIMLGSVYGVDLGKFDFESLPQLETTFPNADLAGLAQRVLWQHDHHYDSQ